MSTTVMLLSGMPRERATSTGLKARPGSIRREFGTNIMVNAAHASDSVENARREMRILDVANDPHFEALIKKYYLD